MFLYKSLSLSVAKMPSGNIFVPTFGLIVEQLITLRILRTFHCFWAYLHYVTRRINASTKIKLIRELSFLLTADPLHILMQKLLKSMINSVNQRYIQHLA